MAGHQDNKRNRRSQGAKARRRVIGLSSGVGGFLALGIAQLAAASMASADEFDALLEPIISSITGSLDDVAAGSAAANPFDTWLQGLEQDWISSSFGQQVDTAFNDWFGRVDPGAAVSTAGPSMSQNLLVDPGFEKADPSGSGYSGVTIPGWTETGTPTVIPYGAPLGYPSPVAFPFPTASGIFGFPQAIPGGGDNFAGGGPVATSSISQTVDVTGAGGTAYNLSADLGGQGWNPSYASTQVTFYDADGHALGSASLNPVTVWDRLGFTGFQERDITGTVPVGATSAQVTTTFTDKNGFLGNYNGGYADNESFTVGDPSLTPAALTPPASDVGHLDHVFLIYLENKGAQDIVGSAGAPYLNSLIDDDGYASNYFALGHPSNPNYIRVLGGSDFGIDYNANPNSIPATAPSLMQELDQAGLPWAGYTQGDDVSGFPFTQFGYVYDNTPAYQADHLLPLTQLATNLQDPSTFPAFSWIVPDEANNGEGPVDTLSGALKFIVTQFTDHQYNVPAADAFAQQEVSAIESSPTWTDPNEKDAIIITFDEDNNNLSLGFGNEGNNVPMIVIPNSGAVTEGGMQSGHFTTGDYYNEYSLMATIEDALRTTPGTLAPLTANDTYAPPMNAFWK